MVTYGSLFSGLGGFEVAFDRAGMQCKWQVEKDKDCLSVLHRHWPDVPKHEDVCAVGRHNLESVDIICGGWPCQDVSVAGLRAGISGARSGLFFEAARVVGELRPALVLLENVPGLLSSHAGRDFSSVLMALHKLGARDIAWRTLDAQYTGVPQRRRRIFLVADFRTGGESAGEILFESSRVPWRPPTMRKARPRVAARLTSGSSGSGINQSGREDDENLLVAGILQSRHSLTVDNVENLIVNALTASGGGPDDNQAMAGHLIAFDLAQITSGVNRTRAEPGLPVSTLASCSRMHVAESVTGAISHALSSEGADASEDGSGRGTPIIAQSVSLRGREGDATAELGGDQACALMSSQGGGDKAYALTRSRVRRLMPVECEKLQGLPENWTRYREDGTELSDSARYRMIGNAVALPVVTWIAHRIVAFLTCAEQEARA